MPIHLQPVAQPTDQFHMPNISAPEPSPLIALAQSLRDLSPDVQQIINNRSQAYVQAGTAEGVQNVHALQIQNQEDLKAAVAAGQISPGMNPWAILSAKQSVAQLEAAQATRELFDSYYKSGLPGQNQIGPVEDFANNFFKQRFQNRDADEWQVLGPQLDNSIHSLLMHHVQHRNEANIEEYRYGLDGNVSSLLDQYAADADTNPESATALDSGLGRLISDGQRFMPNSEINAHIKAIAEKEAEARNDPRLYSRIVGAIKTPGGDLSTTPETTSVVASLQQKQVLNQVHMLETENTVDKLAREKATSVVLNTPGLTPQQVKDMAIPVEVKNSVLQQLWETKKTFNDFSDTDHKTRVESEKQLANDFMTALRQGGQPATDDQLKSIAGKLSDLSFSEVDDLFKQARGIGAKNTDPAVKDSLLHSVLDGTIDARTVNQYAGSLSNEDYAYFTTQVDKAKDQRLAPIRESAKKISENLYSRVYNSSVPDEVRGLTGDSLAKQLLGYPELARQVDDAREAAEAATQRFNGAFADIVSKTPVEGDPSAVTDKLQKFANDVGGLYHTKPFIDPATIKLAPEQKPTGVESYYANLKKGNDNAKRSPEPLLVPLTQHFADNLNSISKQAPPMQSEDVDWINRHLNPTPLRTLIDDKSANSWYFDLPSGVILPPYSISSSEQSQHVQAAIADRDSLLTSLPDKIKTADAVMGSLSEPGTIPSKHDHLTLQSIRADVQAFDSYNQILGYNAKYALNTFGKDSWQNKRLFFNANDLKSRGSEVAKMFGLSDSRQIDSFIVHQQQMIPQANDNASN